MSELERLKEQKADIERRIEELEALEGRAYTASDQFQARLKKLIDGGIVLVAVEPITQEETDMSGFSSLDHAVVIKYPLSEDTARLCLREMVEGLERHRF
jgi:hypothetical protein